VLGIIGGNSFERMALPSTAAFACDGRNFRIGVRVPAKLQMTEETAGMLALNKAIR
jgi:hypothetical protein